MNSTTSKLATLLGTASLLTMANATAQAQMTAQAEEIPETVLITGSLIRGTAAVGVPVTNLSPQDFAQTGALTTGDLFRTYPAANVSPGPVATESGANIERGTRVNLRQLDTGDAARSLLMIDGVRFPGQGNGLCAIDPGIIPALSLERIDVLVDGASATYGADAVGGVINVILKRGFDGAVTQLRYTTGRGGKNRYQASQLWGRTWDGGSVTLSYEWYDESPTHGSGYGTNFTIDFSPWGLDNRIPLQSSLPGTITSGAAKSAGSLPATQGTNCTNCFAIPQGSGGNWAAGAAGVGPTTPFSASTLNWTTFNTAGNSGTNGTRNEFNPYLIAYADAAQQRNGGHIAVDQRLTKDISFFGTGFYSNRRAQFINPSNLSPAQSNDLQVAVPTWNPYYPTGGAPTNLRVAYNIGRENPSMTSAYELAARYQLGLNFALPGDWSGQAFFSDTYDSNSSTVSRTVNRNAVSAALGWTLPASAAAGTTPGLNSWVKPAGIPYLNLFCDPTQFQCNSPATLDYVSGKNMRHEVMNIITRQISASGPVFDLPGGQVKMAVGALLETSNFSFTQFDNTGSPGLVVPYLTDTERRNVWAVFAQLNVPIFTDMNALPFLNRLEFEASIRHDQYSDFGGTTNPKLAFNWTPFESVGVTFRGAWGTSFRAPSFGELSPLTNTAISCQNFPADGSCNPQAITTGAVGAAPPVGSGAWKVNPTGAASLTLPPGIAHLGGSAAPVAAGLRAPGTLNQGTEVLKPEQAFNWALGIEIAPTFSFLQGLDIQATWYKTKITSVLQGFGNPSTTSFNDPAKGFAFLVASDFAGQDPSCATANATPTACAPFEAAALALLSNPRSAIDPALAPQAFWINDGGVFNKGWFISEGIDWNVSYDIDVGDFGAVNAGITGTYYLNRIGQNLNETPSDVLFNVTVGVAGLNQSIGVESRPRMKYRARLGWANGPWSVTGFMNYESHFFHTQGAPPNVNNQCVAAGSSAPGGTFPCAITGYTNIEPPWYTFDLSLGYDTGDDPANDYLKHIGIQLIVQNILDKHADFMYRIASGGGNPCACDLLRSNAGRQISIILTKTW
jgi:outer membrane receptor protein involved in Fe transport